MSSFTELHQHNLNPFPIIYGEKKPALDWKQYQTERVTSEQCALWDGGKYNIGIATGTTSQIFAVDVDGEAGQKTLNALVAENGELPETATVKTGKGWHFYFRYPDDADIPNRAGKTATGEKLEGIDIRGQGGYVVAPSSIHPDGHIYEWFRSPETTPIAEAPAWLIDLVAEKPSTQLILQTQPMVCSEVYSEPYHDKALRGILSDLSQAPSGQRNDALNTAAFTIGQLTLQGLDENAAITRLEAQAYAIGLEPEEISATIASGLAGGKSNPRSMTDAATIAPKPTQTSGFTIDDCGTWEMLNREPPSIDWLYKDLFPAQSVGLLGGGGGVGKTMLTMELALHTALCKPFGQKLNNMPIGVNITSERPLRTLILSAEDDRTMVWHRLKTVTDHLALTEEERKQVAENLFIKYVGGTDCYLTTRKGQESTSTGFADEIVNACQGKGFDLIILDPLSRFRGGGENDNDDATRFINECDKICGQLNCSILLVHHFAKAANDMKHPLADENKYRGAKAILDGSRFGLIAETANNHESDGIKKSEWHNHVRIGFVKVSYGKKPTGDLWLQRLDNGYLEPRPITFDAGAADIKTEKLYSKIKQTIINDAADDKTYSLSSFAKAYSGRANKFKLSRDKLHQIIDDMLAEGELVKVTPETGKRGRATILQVVS